MKKELIKKPFDLETYKEGAKIQTRDGHEVRIICTNAENPRFPIIALAKLYNEEEVVVHYTLEGKALLANTIHNHDLVIVEEIKGPEFWSEDTSNTFSGFSISNFASDGIFTEVEAKPNTELYKGIFATKKQAKSVFAMAMISQIMANDIENFGGTITNTEWENEDYKYVIYRHKNNIAIKIVHYEYHFLAFHTKAQRDLFLEKYRDLVKEYFMFD